jgi:hypothetical protein
LPTKTSSQVLRQGELVETLVLLSALGGDCIDDPDQLRRDQGLAALTGYTLPAASTARQWLDRFHDPAALADRPLQGSFIPAETPGLAGLQTAVAHRVHAYVTAVHPDRTVERATLDHWDAWGWTFAVSADMSPQLRAAVVALPEDAWQPWAEERGGVVRE